MKTQDKTNPQEYSLFSVRMPLEIHKGLAEIANKEGCSLNAMIVKILGERLHTVSVIGAISESDPLSTAYQAAEAAEFYAQAVRKAITNYKTKK